MRKYDKEIDLGHGLFKYVEVEEQSVSEQLQDELEPIFHPTQHDESDEIEEAKKTEGELTEFEKSEIKGKLRIENQEQVADYTDAYWKREFYNLDSTKGEVEWKIVELEGGGFIRRPFPVKKATLAGPDRPESDSSRLIKKVEKHYFRKGEKWEHKYDS